MKLRIRFSSILVVAILSSLTFIAVKPAHAVVAGCDPNKWNEMQARSSMKRAMDIGSTEEQMDKPESLQILTCAPQAFQVSAQQGGAIFSGDFSTEMNNVIGPTMDELLGNFVGSFFDTFNPLEFPALQDLTTILGGISTLFTTGGGGFTCDRTQDLWDAKALSSIDTNASVFDMDWALDVAQGLLPLGPDAQIMQQNLTNAGLAPAAAAVRAAVTAPPIAIPNYAGSTTTCQVLTLALGAPPAGCP